MTFLIEKPGAYPTSLAFIRPFDSALWNLTLAVLFLMPLVMKLLLSTKDTYIHMFLKLLGSVLRQPTISDRDFTKSLSSSWMIFGMILTFSYSAVLLSVLTIPLQIPVVKNFVELSEAVRKNNYRFYIPKGTFILDALRKHEKEHMRYLGESILRNKWFWNAKQKIDKKLATSTVRSVFVSTAGPEDWKRYYLSDDSFWSSKFAFAMKRGFCYKKKLNSIISRLTGAGIYTKFVQDQSFRLSMNNRSIRTVKVETEPLTNNDLIGSFMLLSIGLKLCKFILLQLSSVDDFSGTIPASLESRKEAEKPETESFPLSAKRKNSPSYLRIVKSSAFLFVALRNSIKMTPSAA
ncbi:lig_chan-Glu_bd domain-containing protein [Caerostris darwini]|uniref:Lig_chan-Glu_bd domain-containing protein n=1 Tax=Caerostris darwini TaxID=1538125 RepID=A0AAV4QIS4_9ARAC|nr:lig_chan-Glu_bd domain-containing protein [Caerostris darwini]